MAEMRKVLLAGSKQLHREPGRSLRETLTAIRSGEVECLRHLRTPGEHGNLRGVDHSYRVLLEDMNEGAATLLPDGAALLR